MKPLSILLAIILLAGCKEKNKKPTVPPKSDPEPIVISGANLTGLITITAPPGWEISFDNKNWVHDITFFPNDSNRSVNIYERLKEEDTFYIEDKYSGHPIVIDTMVKPEVITKPVTIKGKQFTPAERARLDSTIRICTPTRGELLDSLMWFNPDSTTIWKLDSLKK